MREVFYDLKGSPNSLPSLAISLTSKEISNKIHISMFGVGGLFMKYNTHVPEGVGRERVWPLPPETLQRPLNQALYVLKTYSTYFRIRL